MFNVVLIMFMLFQLIILIITNIDSIQKIVHAFPHTPKQFYPVLIGYDGERILPQLVNSAFEEVRSNFAVCYNVKYAFLHDENIIAYKFSIRRKVDSLSDEVLQELIQAQVVKILTETMQFFDCYIAAEPLTVIELRKNELLVGFARTQEGIEKVEHMKRCIMRRQAKERTHETASNFTEDWHE